MEQIIKEKGAKRLHRRYVIVGGWRPSIEHDNIDQDTIEFPVGVEEAFLEEWDKYQTKLKQIRGEEALQAVLSLKSREVQVTQRTQEWFKERAGIITGSDTPFTVTGKPIPTFDSYVYSKVAQAFKYGHIDNFIEEDSIKTKAMDDGNELEPLALIRYAKQTGFTLQSKGIYRIGDYRIGASPDSVAFDNELNARIVEVKNLQLNTFIGELIHPSQAQKYKAQLQTEMFCSGIHTADLVIQCTTLPERFDLIIQTVELDKEYLSNMIETINLFELKFDEAMDKLNSVFK